MWGKTEDDEPKPTPGVYHAEPEPAAAHVHDWTEYPSGKRKCKPCGAIERPERDE